MALRRKSRKPTSALQKLEELRLLVAGEINCYLVNTRDESAHIRVEPAFNELLDQYSLKVFLNWLAYKLGFPIYRDAIRTPGKEHLQRLQDCLVIAERYPFYSYFPVEFENRAAAVAFDYLESNLEPTLDLVGSLYMQTLTSQVAFDAECRPYIQKLADGRRVGEFYTPRAVAQRCIQEPFLKDLAILTNEVKRSSDDLNRPFRLLDPACGSGNFLLAALRMFREQAYGKDLGPRAVLEFAADSLFGMDIDMRAVSLAHTLILLEMSSELQVEADSHSAHEYQIKLQTISSQLFRHIVCVDPVTLVAAGPGLQSDPLLAEFGSFDFVVTNPPYISYGARNQPPLHDGLGRFLRHCYPASAEYKIRLHSIFQEVSLRLCRPGGHVVLLVPDAFLNGAFYGKLRRLLLEESRLISLTELPESTFTDAVAGRWCIAHYQKRSSPLSSGLAEDYVVRLCRVDDVSPSAAADIEHPASSGEQIFDLSINRLVSADKSRFQLVFNKMDAAILEKLSGLPFLRSRYRGHTGLRSRLGQAAIIGDSFIAESGNWKRGIVSGADVLQHQVSWSGKWLDITPSKLFAGGFNAAVIEGPKLMVRQTADRLIGGVDELGLYHLNNVHSFAPLVAGGSLNRLQAVQLLSGFLNSRLGLYLYQLKSRENKRALAQIDIEMVESLPCHLSDSALETSIIELVRLTHARKQLAQSSIDVERSIDRLIYDLYNLSDGEVRHIEEVTFGNSKRSHLLLEPLPSRYSVDKLLEFCLQAQV